MLTRKKIQKNRTMRIDDQSTCMNRICSQKKYEKEYNNTKKLIETFEKHIEKQLVDKKYTVEQKNMLEKKLKYYRKTLKNMNNPSKKTSSINASRRACKLHFCNKGCSGTIFEEGDSQKLSNEILKNIKHYKDDKENIFMQDLNLKMRKELFGNKTTVLKDSFYDGLTPEHLNKMKKKGAISGCIHNYFNQM
jgi:hypothetical protein